MQDKLGGGGGGGGELFTVHCSSIVHSTIVA
jgi:hypothetical protein